MRKLNSKPTQPSIASEQAWVVQVYDRDRHLVCLVDPSHGWAFFLGCVAGFVVTAIGFSRGTSPVEAPSPAEMPSGEVVAPLSVD
jgi:hypothetical protein